MQILAALFIDDMAMRQVPGPATRIDLTGVQFSGPAPEPLPFTWTPHLCVLIHCPPDHKAFSALTVEFELDGEQVARNVQPLQIEPGRFGRQLVRPEITFETLGTVYAHCSIDGGAPVSVPYTMLPPVEG
ncbi:MAG: hypothetical protein IT196_16145 [Acidimicrobiales bacterium]|nr:hypothetical protein [Acidimicrobiales bacterium]